MDLPCVPSSFLAFIKRTRLWLHPVRAWNAGRATLFWGPRTAAILWTSIQRNALPEPNVIHISLALSRRNTEIAITNTSVWTVSKASYCVLLLNPGSEQKFSHRLPRACMLRNYLYHHLVCLPLTGRKMILPSYQNSKRSSTSFPRTWTVPFCFRLPWGIHPSSLVWDCYA